jgi:pimeloyl-ACP methyl ester carboxylesterase
MQHKVMAASLTCSRDGTRIAYDRSGAGPAIVLLHGGGGSRQDWHEAGYVTRLQDRYTALTLDLRGHGQSDRPDKPIAYTTDKLCQDILAVADACGVRHFAIWGMSYGGKVGRYLAVRSQRVTALIMMGTPLGPGVSGARRQQALEFRAHWSPLVQALQAGTLDLDALSSKDRETWDRLHVPSMLGWVRAMLDWPAIVPAQFRCPTLWLIGSEDQHAMESLHTYGPALCRSQVQVRVEQDLDHEQVFEEVDRVLPVMLGFMASVHAEEK